MWYRRSTMWSYILDHSDGTAHVVKDSGVMLYLGASFDHLVSAVGSGMLGTYAALVARTITRTMHFARAHASRRLVGGALGACWNAG